jgi:hypothetical protein
VPEDNESSTKDFVGLFSGARIRSLIIVGGVIGYRGCRPRLLDWRTSVIATKMSVSEKLMEG